MTIDRWITDAAAKNPDKTALAFNEEKISYADFASLIDSRVREFEKAGVAHGNRVAWYGLNHPDVFVLLFACARIGAIFVPLNWRLAEAEVAAIVANCEPSLLYFDHNFAKPALALSDVDAIDHQLAFADTDHLQANKTNEANKAKLITPTTSDPLLLVYTSGSTGLPKGALLSQNSVICNASMSVEAHDMSERDAVLVLLPLFHVGGLNILPTPAFSIGATVILHDRFEPDRACRGLQKATLSLVVPTVLKAMMASKLWDTIDFSAVRGISIGSTDVPVSLIKAIHKLGVPMPQVYGATETGPFAIYQTLQNAMHSVGSIGRAGSGCKIRLVANNQDVSIGEPGEIWVRGVNVLDKYWQDNELSAQALQDGWLRTGDIATCDADGFYWFNDRIKHVIISGGENIYPSEIERVLTQISGIREVCIVGKPDTKWGEIPVAVVVTNTDMSRENILSTLQGQLARYKHPKEVVFVDELPRNAMGKVVAKNVRKLIE